MDLVNYTDVGESGGTGSALEIWNSTLFCSALEINMNLSPWFHVKIKLF